MNRFRGTPRPGSGAARLLAAVMALAVMATAAMAVPAAAQVSEELVLESVDATGFPLVRATVSGPAVSGELHGETITPA